jgi:cell division protein FtsB
MAMTTVDREHDELMARPTPLRSRQRSRNSVEARLRRRRLLSYIALVVSAGFMINALVGEKGLLGRLKARQDYDAVSAGLTRLRNENTALLDEARRLHNDPAAIEEVARRKLNLIRPGEILIIIKDAKPPAGQ